MINILELESSLGFGGQEHRTQRVINGLDKSKFKVFYGLNTGSKSFKKQIECEFVEFNLKKSFNIFEIFKICKFVKQNNIKIISTHSGKDGIIGAIVSKITGAKVVRTRHLQTPIRSPFSYNINDKIVVVSNAVKTQLIYQGVQERLIETIYTGVDTDKFTPHFKKDIRDQLNLPANSIIVGVVAVLRAAKNHKILFEAFNELNLPNTFLVVVGDGPQYENLQNIKTPNILMLGNRADVSDFLGSFDLFVLPSKMEALGTALLEAQSCAVPCIGSNVGGIGEAIKDNKTGLLFENDNKEELKKVLERLILDENLRKQMGEFGREYVKEVFSIEKMIENTQNLYMELVK
ncbi:glycosyltransferase family 4 protein [Campylobacter concisus]|uniref:glycosyltransferase family 4 protein n=1 Tax=Campylobacter concisus TaxID=199 RepID=UPI0018835C72|nr:glycosyltransferase family 4 protein [Campylobacter concisus]MBE9851855.1 glycosyltransferase family 4 protein [Campylobacter concisus]